MRPLFHALAACLPLLTVPAAAQVAPPWVPVIAFPGRNYLQAEVLQLPNPTSAWVVQHDGPGMGSAYITIRSSADNGTSWQEYDKGLSLPGYRVPPSGIDFPDLWALSGQEAWAVTQNLGLSTRELWHTTTGAAGFAIAPVQVPGQVLVRFFTPTTGVVLSTTAGTPIYRSTDGGQTWQPVAAPPTLTNLTDATATTCTVLGQNAWVVGANSQLARTTDAGLTWTTVTTPTTLNTLAFRDALHGLAYGATSTGVFSLLYRTADGGLTWTQVLPSGPLRYPSYLPTIRLAAVPDSPGTYLSASPIGQTPGTVISYDEGAHWLTLENTYGASALAADATGRVWSFSAGFNVTYVNYLPRTVLATAAPQAAMAAGAYPNPTTGLLHLPAAGAYRQVTVYDAAGRQCRTAMLGATETNLDLTSLGQGLYLLRLAGGPAPAQQQRIAVTAP